MANFCGQCGSDTTGALRFCPRCGAAMAAPPAAEPIPYDAAAAPTVQLPAPQPPYGPAPTYGQPSPYQQPGFAQPSYAAVSSASTPPSCRTALIATVVAVVLLTAAAGAYFAFRPAAPRAVTLVNPTPSATASVAPGADAPGITTTADSLPSEEAGPEDALPSDDALPPDLALPPDEVDPADEGVDAGGEVVAPLDGQPLAAASIRASCTAPTGHDGKNAPTSYEANKAIDGDQTTTWRCRDGAEPYTLTLDLGSPMVVTRLGLIPGFAKVDPKTHDDRWVQNRRITSVTYSFDDGTSVDQQFDPNERSIQMAEIAPVQTQVVTITITGTVPGMAGYDYTAISELEVDGGEG